VLRNALLGQWARLDANLIPRATFTDPEVAHVGITDAEAARRGLSYRVLRWPYGENDRARIEHATNGHIKAITDVGGRILGATIVGTGASELIATWSLAVAQGLDIRAVAGTILPYPTLGDIGKRAAMTYFTARGRRTWVRRMTGLLHRSR